MSDWTRREFLKLDAVWVLTSNGPTGGDLNVERLDTVLAQAAYPTGLGDMGLDKGEVRIVRV